MNEERIETDPVSGSAWAVREGMSWAQRGVFALIKGHQSREVALGYVLATQPHVGRMYGGLSTAWTSGVWDADHQTYVKYGTLRLLHEYEFDAGVLEAQFLQQPHFLEVKEGVGYPVHTHDVVRKVRHYVELQKRTPANT